MFTTTYTDVFSGNNVTPAFPQYSFINLSANTLLAWPAQFQNSLNVVTVFMNITPTAGGFTLTMPDARQVGTGFEFTINNTNHAFNLLDNLGNVIANIAAPSVNTFVLTSNATQGGTWIQIPYGGGYAAVTSVNAVSTSSNLVITGTPGLPITTIGTINFALANDLLSLSSFGGGSGIAVREDATHWFMRQIAGTANQISIGNADGTAGNPTVALVPDVVLGSSLTAGNLKLGPANTLSSINANGPILLDPNGTGQVQLAAGTSLAFLNGTNNYISFFYPTSGVNQAYTWPSAAAVPGQVLGYSPSGGGLLSWLSVITTGGTTTLHGIARYSNTVGGLADSSVLIDDTWNITGATSLRVGDLGISTSAANTIITVTSDEDLILSPNGNGSTISQGDIIVKQSSGIQRKLRLYNTANTFYAALRAYPTMPANVTWTLPQADSAGVFLSDGAGNVSLNSFFLGGTPNVVPTFTATAGLLQNSAMSIVAGAATGLTSCTFGNINVGTTANTISTIANNDLNLAPNGTGNVISQTDLQIKSVGNQRKIQLWNSAATFYTALQSNATSNLTFTLPTAFPGTAGTVKCDTAGNLSVSSVTTTIGMVPTYGDTIGTLDSSGVYIDGSDNLSIGTTSIGTSGTNSITLDIGASVTAVGAGLLSIGNRNTGTGNVLALYGAGDGGISGSVDNVVTNKISVYVNGTRYYLMATTSAA